MEAVTGLLPLLGSVFAASLAGSPHCAGMCGGFVCFYAGHGDASRGLRRLVPHLAYNGGRLAAYVTLGAIAGLLGAGIDRAGSAAGVARAAAIVAGALMVVWGGHAMLAALGVRLGRLPHPVPPLAPMMRSLAGRSPASRALAIGLLTALLPCGWLYAFVATAGATASASVGALVMAGFWLGTLPVMSGVGVAAQALTGPIRRRLPALTAATLIVVGLLTIAGKFQPGRAAATVCHAPAEAEAGHGPR